MKHLKYAKRTELKLNLKTYTHTHTQLATHLDV